MDIAPRRTLAAALLAGGVLVLSGCGGDSTPTDPEGGGETTAGSCEWMNEEPGDRYALGIVPNVTQEYLDDIHPGDIRGTFKTDMIDPGQFVIGSDAFSVTGSDTYDADFIETVSIYAAEDCDTPLETVAVSESDFVMLEGTSYRAWFVDSGLTDLGPDDNLVFEVRGSEGKLEPTFCWEPKSGVCEETLAGVVEDHMEKQ